MTGNAIIKAIGKAVAAGWTTITTGIASAATIVITTASMTTTITTATRLARKIRRA